MTQNNQFKFILNLTYIIKFLVPTRDQTLRALAAQQGRGTRLGPRGTRRAGSVRNRRKPRVSEPKLVLTREGFFWRLVAQNAAYGE